MKEQNKDDIIAALQKEIDTLKTVIHMMPGNIFWADTESRFMGCNNNVAKLVNVTPDEITGKLYSELFEPDLAEKMEKNNLEVMQNKQETIFEENAFAVGGKPAVYLTRKTPFYNRLGEVQGILGISFDITERKIIEKKLSVAKQKAESANRAKSKFLATISHELRTPLTSLIGFIGFLEQDNLSADKRKEYIKHSIHSGAYLLSLINNILDYSKLETNQLKLTTSTIDLKELIDNVISMLEGIALIKKITLRVEYDVNAPTHIITDSMILQQILVNLVGNGIKFTEKGHVIIRVSCIETTSELVTLQIAVEDTGIGIPTHAHQAIFKRFYQLENVYTRNTSLMGTGLGLSIVKKLVKLLGGKIEVKSEMNRGSIFYFNASFLRDPVSDNTHLASDNNPYVLLVEDNSLIQIIHKHMLDELKCHVDIAESATETLAMLQNNYDALFIDIGLPDMPGFELIQTIRKEHATNPTIPIIVLTAYSNKHEHQQCLRAGANEVVVKPVDKTHLKNLLYRYVKKIPINEDLVAQQL